MPATLLDYAYMAAACYAAPGHLFTGEQNVEDKFDSLRRDGNAHHEYWKVIYYQAGSPADGFQGAIFEGDDQVICAYKGSKGGFFDKKTTGYDDWCVNDVQIARNQIPKQAVNARKFAQQGKVHATNKKRLSLVGHSLGGALAQVVGVQESIPFVTFNAPGMATHLPVRHPGKVPGFNMILWTDPVGNAGKHVGKTERFGMYVPFTPMSTGGGGNFAHVMTSVIYTLKHSTNGWATKTLNELV
jgi:hypothetical protein